MKENKMWKEVANEWKNLYLLSVDAAKHTVEKVHDAYYPKDPSPDQYAVMDEYRGEVNEMSNSELIQAIHDSVPGRLVDRTFLDWVYIAAAERLHEDE